MSSFRNVTLRAGPFSESNYPGGGRHVTKARNGKSRSTQGGIWPSVSCRIQFDVS